MMILIRGKYKLFFWVGIVIFGLVLPLLIHLVPKKGIGIRRVKIYEIIACLLIIAEGLILRILIVSAGQALPLM